MLCPLGELAALAALEVDHMQLGARRAEQSGAVGLVVEPVGDERAALRSRVDRGREGQPGTVRAPDRRACAERKVRLLLGLSPVGPEDVHLALAQEREPAAVGRPGR